MNNKDLFHAMGGIEEDLLMLADKKEHKGAIFIMTKQKKALFGLAACFILLVAVGSILGVYFSGQSVKVTTAGGTEVSFHKISVSQASFDLDLPTLSREFTQNELKTLFPFAQTDLSGIGWFDEATGTPLRLEGKIGDIKVILAQKDTPLSDTVIDEAPKQAQINGVSVLLGTLITDKNSKGEQTAVFCATLTVNGYGVYLEGAGNKEQASLIAQAVADTAEQIIDSGLESFDVLSEK